MIQAKAQSIVPFDFYGDQIDVVQSDDTVWVSVRRVCEALGIDRWTQQKKLQKAIWARGGIMPLHDIAGRFQDAFMLELDSLPMWLATISPNKVAADLKQKLERYQCEAAGVLRDHFLGNPKKQMFNMDIDTLTKRRKYAVRLLGEALREGLIGETYVERYVKHSLATIDGTAPPEGPRLIDVSTFLEGKGFSKEECRQYSSRFGKAVKALYLECHGRDPEKGIRFINGSERYVNSYTETDIPLFNQAYDKLFEGKALRGKYLN